MKKIKGIIYNPENALCSIELTSGKRLAELVKKSFGLGYYIAIFNKNSPAVGIPEKKVNIEISKGKMVITLEKEL